ncbi:multidrug resistance efflux transporter family protein [Periweissella ghanensis]|uniref:Multidrug resistance efflux transporter family protein n=1 Tax=Periweissella ghanensis TaxID=467997 RepID=A0ABN8BNN0_9LACO|nr:multidrug resistance efflux transporter family protein [Periweissella ghanensis]MCM0601194.1 multidrug resistance efflux transporter family protein [Periweissella ghanensis]CAH0417994.1 hypothetical protein WGH24286_00410 [Periweissella ghanensis]
MNLKAIFLGILAALFFSLTFLLNQLNLQAAGYWLWVASLRYLWMLPMIALLGTIPQLHADFAKVWRAIKAAPWYWLGWSNVCFVLFYVPLTWSAQFLPGWLVSSLWQLTIIFGVLTTPLMKVADSTGIAQRLTIPRNKIKWMLVILVGITLTTLQAQGLHGVNRGFGWAILAILMAAICYPLGNRQIGIRYGHFNGLERVFGMLLATYPTFIVLSIISYLRVGRPDSATLLSTFGVALASGVIATVLFFHATALAGQNMETLATVEATQSFEVIFTVLLGLLFLGHALPSHLQMVGLLIMLLGIIGINFTGVLHRTSKWR